MSAINKSDYDEKMDEIIYNLEILIMNALIDVLERLNERNEDQMLYETTITCV